MYGGVIWRNYSVRGAPACCRQHANDDDVIEIDDEDVKPKKKKSRKSKG